MRLLCAVIIDLVAVLVLVLLHDGISVVHSWKLSSEYRTVSLNTFVVDKVGRCSTINRAANRFKHNQVASCGHYGNTERFNTLAPLKSTSSASSSTSYVIPQRAFWNRNILPVNGPSDPSSSSTTTTTVETAAADDVTVEYEGVVRQRGESSDVTTTYVPVLHFHRPMETLRILRPRTRTSLKDRLLHKQFLPDFTVHIRGASASRTSGSISSDSSNTKGGGGGGAPFRTSPRPSSSTTTTTATTTTTTLPPASSVVELAPAHALYPIQRRRDIISPKKQALKDAQSRYGPASVDEVYEKRHSPVSTSHGSTIFSSIIDRTDSTNIRDDGRHLSSNDQKQQQYASTSGGALEWFIGQPPLEVVEASSVSYLRAKERSALKDTLIKMQSIWASALSNTSSSSISIHSSGSSSVHNGGATTSSSISAPTNTYSRANLTPQKAEIVDALGKPMTLMHLLAPRQSSSVKNRLVQMQSHYTDAQGYSSKSQPSDSKPIYGRTTNTNTIIIGTSHSDAGTSDRHVNLKTLTPTPASTSSGSTAINSNSNSKSSSSSFADRRSGESSIFSPAGELLQAVDGQGRLPKDVAHKLKDLKKSLVAIEMGQPYSLQSIAKNRSVVSGLKQRLMKFQKQPYVGTERTATATYTGTATQLLLQPMTLVELARPRGTTELKSALMTMYPQYRRDSSSSSNNANNRESSYRGRGSERGVGGNGGDTGVSNAGGSTIPGTYRQQSTYGYRSSSMDGRESSDRYNDDASRFRGRGSIKEIPPAVLEEFVVKKTPAIDVQRYLRETYNLNLGIRDIMRAMHEAVSTFAPGGGRGRRHSGKTNRDRMNSQRRSEAEEGSKSIDVAAESCDGSTVVVSKLAERLGKSAAEVVKHLIMNKGILATINQGIPIAVAEQVAEDLGFQVIRPNDNASDAGDSESKEGRVISVNAIDRWADVSPQDAARRATWTTRSPVVTVMGHVDHGKTSLLDRIRRTSVAASEAGGITQGISAFSVPIKTSSTSSTSDENGQNSDRTPGKITFIDTPGHAAFSAMRSRGANITDIVVLVIAADDGIMEQTKECISALKAAGSPVVVAINKVDKEGVDPQKVLFDLMNYGLMPEEFGGDVQVAMISARTGEGVEDLLDKIAVQAEIMDLRAPTDGPAQGVVVESRVRKGMGAVATVLVQKGTLHVGDLMLAGGAYGKIKRLLLSGSTSGSGPSGGGGASSGAEVEVKECGPSTPVHVVGLGDLPSAGDAFEVSTDLNAIKQVATARKLLHQQAMSQLSKAAVTSMASNFVAGTLDTRERFKVPLVVVTDSSGSLEALLRSIVELKDEDEAGICVPDIVSSSIGPVTSGDVALAATTGATIVAFKAPISSAVENEAKQANIPILDHQVVYALLDEVKSIINKKLNPMPPGIFVGRAEVLKLFKFKTSTIAGCRLLEGSITKEASIRVLRGKRNVVYTGKAASLRLVKDVVEEISGDPGMEFGISCSSDFNDFEEGDVIECFKPTSTVALDTASSSEVNNSFPDTREVVM